MNWSKATPEEIDAAIREAIAKQRGITVSPKWLLSVLQNQRTGDYTVTTNEPLMTTVESLDRAASDIDSGIAGMTVSQVRDAVHDAKMAHVLKAAHEAAMVALEAAEKRAATFESTANSLRDCLDRLGAAAEKIYGDSEHGWTFGEAIGNLVEDAAKWKSQSSLTEHKYLNPICGQDGCQWLVAEHQAEVYRKQMADDAYRFMRIRFMRIENYCRKHLHCGVSPGKQEACGEVLKMLEGE